MLEPPNQQFSSVTNMHYIIYIIDFREKWTAN